uniref:C-type lectin domain-containing protein n=1 Tax=Acrobeloides nanus TaxID=290746 RepID=A0A914BVM5_9BILA
MKFLVFLATVVLGSALVVPKNLAGVKSIIGSDSIGTPCSRNVSNLWVNIFLVIDISTLNVNLNKQLQFLASELAQVPVGQINDPHTSRVSIITYSDSATILADLHQLNSNDEVTQALLSIKQDDKNSVYGWDLANRYALAIRDDYDNWDLYGITDIPRQSSFIFVDDFSFYDPNVTEKRLNISREFVQPKQLITLKRETQKTMVQRREKSGKYGYESFLYDLTTVNCFCERYSNYYYYYYQNSYQFYAYDYETYTYEYYADCYERERFYGFDDYPAYGVCEIFGGVTTSGVAVTSPQKESFISYAINYQYDYTDTPDLYIGLHRNEEGQLVWTDYDGSEIPLGNYTNFINGNNGDGDCFANVYNNETYTYQWESRPCFSDDLAAICQFRACDADNTACGLYNYGVKKTKMEKKLRQLRGEPKKQEKQMRQIHRVKKH